MTNDTIIWDGKQHSYRPSEGWLDGLAGIEFYEESDPDLDPVTFEVIRNRLWANNLAHGEALVRISGSPIFQSLDFNMCVLTADGQMVSNGPFITYLVMGAPLAVPYIMEHFGERPGIEEGDVFLVSDPWIGSSHQMDVIVAQPVFADGKLFAWVSNAGHQYDMGGIVPGGWPQNAPDIYHDPVMFTPFKIVERGELRPDLEEMYRRQSRMPNLVALDLRAQLGGLNFAVEELHELCGRFGYPTVHAAMGRILDSAQSSFAEKLERVPDGTWRDVRYLDEKMPGDRESYRVQVNVRKEGGKLIIDNEGTEAQQDGPIGFNFASFSGAVLGTLSVTMLHDQLFAVGGAARQIEYEVVPGTLSCVDHPSPVSGGIFSIINCINSLMLIVSRMLMCDEDLKSDVVGAQTEWPLLVLAGENDEGEQIGTALMEPIGSGSAGKPTRDGTDTNGMAWTPLMTLMNIEAVERAFPIVYLYRRERQDGGGAGRQRGGTGMDFAVTPYRAKAIEAITNTGGMGVSTHGAMGLCGGYPCPTCRHVVFRDTELQRHLAAGEVPDTLESLNAAEVVVLRGKSNGTPMATGDVIEGSFGGGGGYGDPLERSVEEVLSDVRLGYVGAGSAEAVYGVVVDPETGSFDESRTAELRASLLDERMSWPMATDAGVGLDDPRSITSTPATGEPDRPIHETIVACDRDGTRVLSCSRCDAYLAELTGDYKAGMRVDIQPVTMIPGVDDPSQFIDGDFVFRRYCCPSCGVLTTCEIARRDEPAWPEVRLVGDR